MASDPQVLIVGRLSGPKNEVILHILRQVAPHVLSQLPRTRFTVVGGPVAGEHLRMQEENPAIRFEGHQKDLKPYYQKATVVVGAGRVALEAMSLKKPVVAIGERQYIGPLLPEAVEQAKATNFGDCWDKEDFDWVQMARDLAGLLKDPKTRAKAARTGYELVKAEYDQKTLYPKLEALYQKVLLEKNLSLVHELPVLMYHRVVKEAPAYTKYNLHVTQADLERQLLFLKARGFETLTFEDLQTQRLPKKPIILTFDDGYEDNYHYLLPLLKKYKMKAVIYILADRKHRTNFWDIPQGEPEAKLLREKQIREMAASGFVEFGSHSFNHLKLTAASPKETDKEVAGSKKALEELLGKTVFSFAYPYGSVNEEIKKRTAAAGYNFGVAVGTGPTRFGEDRMEIRRVHMFPHTSPFEYWKKTSGYYLRYRALTRSFRKSPKADA